MTGHIGQLLDTIGVQADVDAGDLVASAVVILSILVEGDPNPRLCIASSDGLSWIEQAGMLRLAERIVSEPPVSDDDE